MEQGGSLVATWDYLPSHYPNGAAPSFILDTDTTIDIASQQELIRVSNMYVSHDYHMTMCLFRRL